MNSIEEKLWDYIDGNGTDNERDAVSQLIAADEAVRIKYNELLALNNEFAAMDLDEPPMAFTYNIMEAIRTEHAQQPLKAAINKRIIWGIGIFFGITILALMVFTLSSIDFSGSIAFKIPATFKMPDVSNYISKPMMEGFLFFDTLLALFLFDKSLRRKNFQNQEQ